MGPPHELLRQLPKVDQVLLRAEVAALSEPRWAVVEAVRREIDELRREILAGRAAVTEVEATAIARRARQLAAPSLRRVVNATGVVLHTNLGRAPLPAEVLARVVEIAGGYSNLEYDLEAGARGSRHGHLQRLVAELTGAEDAVVVNNNAGAVMLGLAALAGGREVIVSRGELVEIGGSFRIPDVMRLSGAILVEVGTTNKTRIADFEDAITEDTAMLLEVHRSNFAIVGFTEKAGTGELAELARDRGLTSMVDLGSGALLEAADWSAIGLPGEPGVRQVVASGVDLCTFSGDKLLGGPQAGLVVGSAAAVGKVRGHPLMRALRPDKLTLAALEATLTLYRDGRATELLPALAMLHAPLGELRRRAEELAGRIGEAPAGVLLELVSCASTVGGGAMPTAELPSWGLALGPAAEGDPGAAVLDGRLRSAPVPVVGRIADDRLLLDLRTISAGDLDAVVAAVRAL